MSVERTYPTPDSGLTYTFQFLLHAARTKTVKMSYLLFRCCLTNLERYTSRHQKLVFATMFQTPSQNPLLCLVTPSNHVATVRTSDLSCFLTLMRFQINYIALHHIRLYIYAAIPRHFLNESIFSCRTPNAANFQPELRTGLCLKTFIL